MPVQTCIHFTGDHNQLQERTVTNMPPYWSHRTNAVHTLSRPLVQENHTRLEHLSRCSLSKTRSETDYLSQLNNKNSDQENDIVAFFSRVQTSLVRCLVLSNKLV